MKSWVAYGGRTALNTQQLKLGLGCSAHQDQHLKRTGVTSPKSATTHQNVDAVYAMVMGALRVTLVQMVDTLGLRYGTVNTSLQIELKVIKCAT